MDQKEFKRCGARNDTLAFNIYYQFRSLAVEVILWEVAAEYVYVGCLQDFIIKLFLLRKTKKDILIKNNRKCLSV